MNKLSQISLIWRHVLRLLRDSAPGLSILVGILTILEALAGIGFLYIIKLLVDTITSELAARSDSSFETVLQMLVIAGASIAGVVLLQSTSSILRMRQGLLVSDHVDRKIHDLAISVDMKFYESPEYYDALERAREGGSRRPAQIVANTITMFRAVILLTGIFFLIGSIEWLLLPALVVPILIALSIRLFFTRKLFDWRMSRAQTERRAGYLDWVMTKILHAKDLRVNGVGEYFRDNYRTLRRQLRSDEIRIEQSRLLTELAMAIVGAVVFVAASGWLLQQSLTSDRPIGDVVLFVLLLRRAESAGNEFVGNTSKIVDDHLYLKRLFDFLAVVPSIKRPEHPAPVPGFLKSGLELKDVSFKYDGADKFALQDVNLTLRPNQIVALVGENGSGKTTLIKLLTRLYDPTVGRVMLEGTDIRKFDPKEFRKLLSVIFQDYAVYAETVEDNIRFGDVSIPYDERRVVEAATNSGAASFITELPGGYKTPLTKLFDGGHDLSIGQWQRVALARALYPKSEFVILDEPTSAVDPKAEFELFENFKTRLGRRAALIISHRLSTVRQADYTYVLEAGKIVEHGTHDTLVRRGGKYADLFEKQARFYR